MGARVGLALRHLFERRDVDLDVEMARVGHDRAILHHLEVMSVDHVDVAGHGTEDIADLGSFHHRHDLVTIHDGFQRLERIHFGDNDQRAHATRP